MDFVASRAAEKKTGWRNRVGDFLKAMGVTIFDPWYKPGVRGLHEYGREDESTVAAIRRNWTFAPGPRGARQRAWCAEQFRKTLHIDLRMVDTSDFTISYCPTNIYSVGTPHEIVMATLQHKPVLFVSPPVTFPVLHELREHLQGDPKGRVLLAKLEREVPVRENPNGNPSLWYLPLIGGENFFDGFGFAAYRKRCGWTNSHLHQFTVGKKTFSAPSFDFDDFEGRREVLDEDQATLQQVAPKPKCVLGYEYDFGDSWQHLIAVEKILPPDPAVARIAQCLDGARACPPDDCGGAGGYSDLLKILGDPGHEEHESMKDWLGRPFDPDTFNRERINRHLRKLKWPHTTESQLGRVLMQRDGVKGSLDLPATLCRVGVGENSET